MIACPASDDQGRQSACLSVSNSKRYGNLRAYAFDMLVSASRLKTRLIRIAPSVAYQIQ